MKKDTVTLSKRVAYVGKEAYIMKIPANAVIQLSGASDGPFGVYARSDDGKFHPLEFVESGEIDRRFHVVGADELVIQGRSSSQRFSLEIDTADYVTDPLDYTPAVLVGIGAADHEDTRLAIMREIARFVVSQEEQDDPLDDADYEFDEDGVDFNGGYMESDPDFAPPVVPDGVPEPSDIPEKPSEPAEPA